MEDFQTTQHRREQRQLQEFRKRGEEKDKKLKKGYGEEIGKF